MNTQIGTIDVLSAHAHIIACSPLLGIIQDDAGAVLLALIEAEQTGRPLSEILYALGADDLAILAGHSTPSPETATESESEPPTPFTESGRSARDELLEACKKLRPNTPLDMIAQWASKQRTTDFNALTINEAADALAALQGEVYETSAHAESRNEGSE